LGYRQEGDRIDSRPRLDPAPFWSDATEERTYEAAVEAHRSHMEYFGDGRMLPREGTLEYLGLIVAAVKGRYAKAGRAMPSRLGHRRYTERMERLERQRTEIRQSPDGPWEDR
jgi:hypothetical protein